MPEQKSKVWWKSKGFWGGVISVASVVVPLPLRPIVAVVGGAVGIYGRATAEGPLTSKPNPQLTQ
jgi:hypothetical protein